MIKLFLHDAFTFNYKLNINKVDLIFSSPPFFNPKGKFNFGITGKEHYEKLFNLFSRISKQLKARRCLIHCAEDTLVSFKKREEKIIKIKIKIEHPVEGNWFILNKSDVIKAATIHGPYDFFDKKSSILDPFCGTGNLLLPFKNLGHDCYGIDSSENQLDIAKKNLAYIGTFS